MSGKSNPQRHHFVPQFYLREWYLPGCDHFLIYGRDSRGQLYARARPSKSVGFESDLYTIYPDGLNFQSAKSQQLESDFFAPIDNLASKVHQKMLCYGLDSLTAQDRIDWSKFISSMLYRSPARVNEATKLSVECIEKTLSNLGPQRMRMLNKPIFSALGVSLNKQSLAKNLALEQIVSATASDEFVQGISSMEWALVKLPLGEDHYLTSDAPIVINAGQIKDPIYMFSLAISPKVLMVIFKEKCEFEDMLKLMAVVHNGLLTHQTNKHLVSSRTLVNGMFIKHKKIAELMLCTDNSILGRTKP